MELRHLDLRIPAVARALVGEGHAEGFLDGVARRLAAHAPLGAR